jgi:hypothetical protein
MSRALSEPAPREELLATRGLSWRQSLSRHPEIAVAGFLLVTGVTLMVVGWFGIMGSDVVTERIAYVISGELLGFGLILAAGALATSSLVGQESERFRRSMGLLVGALHEGKSEAAREILEGRARPEPMDGRVFLVPGGRAYHVARCPTVIGAASRAAVLRAEAEVSGFVACKLCRPDRS